MEIHGSVNGEDVDVDVCCYAGTALRVETVMTPGGEMSLEHVDRLFSP